MYEMTTPSAEEGGKKPELLHIAWGNAKMLTYCNILVYSKSNILLSV